MCGGGVLQLPEEGAGTPPEGPQLGLELGPLCLTQHRVTDKCLAFNPSYTPILQMMTSPKSQTV